VIYLSFADICKKIQSKYNFEINISRPWDLCKFRAAYGEIFESFIKGYDFWGYCDLDLIFGEIRKFVTDSILDTYEKIGYQGHSTLFKNNSYINSIYKISTKNSANYEDVFAGKISCTFDENEITKKFDDLNIKQYTKTNFAHLGKFDHGFYLRHFSKADDYKNKHQIFIWDKGSLYRFYSFQNKVFKEEFMYIHFWCRPMTYTNIVSDYYLIYADKVIPLSKYCIDPKFIKKYSKNNLFVFYFKMFLKNRKKITFKKIVENIKIRKTLKKTNYDIAKMKM